MYLSYKGPSLSCPWLSVRQVQYIRLVLRSPEPSTDQIAEHMGLSPSTVETHRGHAYHKLEVSTRLELYFKAVELGIVECACMIVQQRKSTSSYDARE